MAEFIIRVAVSCPHIPTMVSIPLKRRSLVVGAISGAHYQIRALHAIGTISSIINVYGQQKYSGKADQLTLANGGNENT